jgi:hypothetical protein
VPQAPQPALQATPIDAVLYASDATGATSTLSTAFWFMGAVAVGAVARPLVAAAIEAKNAETAANVQILERRVPHSLHLALQGAARRAAVSMTMSTNESSWSDKAMTAFKNDYPFLAKYGFGLSVKCERWNGRHAMFGWAMIFATAACKKYGVFPDPAVALSYKDWGALTQLGFGQYISNERAIIMIAHIHALGISAAAAFGPQVLGDTLTLLDGEEDEEPYGVMIPIRGNYGLTPAAEMVNGRLAMLGIVVLVFSSTASGKDILDIVDLGVGGLLKAAK